MYKMINKTFRVTNLDDLQVNTYTGMRHCTAKTGISYYKLNKLCNDLENTSAFITNDKGKMFRVEVVSGIEKSFIEAIPEHPEYFSNIEFKSITKLAQQFGVSKKIIYARWKKAYPVYEDNPTELKVLYYQNSTKDALKCKSGNAYGEKFLLRFYKPYPEDSDAFEKYKGYGRYNEEIYKN